MIELCQSDLYVYNFQCLEHCPENSRSNGDKNCECLYLYSKDEDNFICYEESVKFCGEGITEEYPFTVPRDDNRYYCMKFCPSQFQFLFYKYCYEKCPEYLVQNIQKKNVNVRIYFTMI